MTKKKVLIDQNDAIEIYNLTNTQKTSNIEKALAIFDKIFKHKIKTTFQVSKLLNGKCPIGCASGPNIIIHPDSFTGKYRSIAHLKKIIPSDMKHSTAIIFHEYQHVRQRIEKLFPFDTETEILEKDAINFTKQMINIIFPDTIDK